MRLFRISLIVVGFTLGATAAHATCPTWHSLSNGTTADATQVMDNFNVILNCANFVGAVGIGNASPAAPLDIVGGVAPWVGIKIEDANPGTYHESVFLGQVANLYGYIGSGEYQVSTGWRTPYTTAANIRFNDDGSIAFTTDSGLTAGVTYYPTTRMTITAAGWFGLGTTSPDALLDISSTNANAQLTIDSAGTNNGTVMRFKGGTVYNWQVGSSYNLNGFEITRSTAAGGNTFSTPFLAIQVGGNVGIGTTSPDMLLTVNGGADKPSGGSWSTFSDLRLKAVFGPYSKGLTEIVRLNPVWFRYRPGNPLGLPSDSMQAGIIAQEVQPVFPETVTSSRGGYLEFNMSAIQFAMINAFKELKEKSDLQAEEIASLKMRLSSADRLTATVEKQAAALRILQAEVSALQKASRLRTAAR